jgi:hypothetical protein
LRFADSEYWIRDFARSADGSSAARSSDRSSTACFAASALANRASAANSPGRAPFGHTGTSAAARSATETRRLMFVRAGLFEADQRTMETRAPAVTIASPLQNFTLAQRERSDPMPS